MYDVSKSSFETNLNELLFPRFEVELSRNQNWPEILKIMLSTAFLRRLSPSHVQQSAAAAVFLTTKSGKLLTLSATSKVFENCRKMSNYLVDDPKYAFLKDIGIEKLNPGVFNGKWGGSGEVSRYCKVLNHSC